MEARFIENYEDGKLIEKIPQLWTWFEISTLKLEKILRADIGVARALDAWLDGGETAEAWAVVRAWSNYRVELRDIEKRFKTPDEVEFPTAPEVVK